MFFSTKVIDCCHTDCQRQTDTQHIGLIKCNENEQNLNVSLDDGSGRVVCWSV